MATLNFNAATVEPNQAFEVIPDGWYNVRIIKSEMKPTKDGKGSYLALTHSIIDGQYANRQLFDRLNLNNANQVAKDIAYQTLSAICHATGVIQLQDSSQLHGIPMQAKVVIKPAEGKYDAGNEIKGYKAIAGQAAPGFISQPAAAPAWAAPAQAAPSPVQAPVPQAAAPASPPWAAQ